MSLASFDDPALLGLIATGRADALSELYDRYGRLVYTVAFHIVNDAETAEEITQDVFLRVWDGAAAYRVELAKVSSWIISIARHRAIDELRRRSARPEKAQFSWDELEWSEPADKENPVEQIETLIQRRNVRQAITALPQEQRQVLGMAFFKGYSHSEIADLLGQPLGTVKSRIRMAMLKLRDVFLQQGVADE